MKPPPDPSYRHRFPAEIISHAVWLYHVFSLSLRDGRNLYGGFGVKWILPCASSFRCVSIAPITTRWHDGDDRVEIEIGDSLKSLGGCTVAQAVGQRIVPSDILGL